MILQIPTPCLSQFSYYIESKGEAVIVDPLRDISSYETILQERGANLKFVVETHFHADYVGGHFALADKYNCDIIFGPNKQATKGSRIVRDNEYERVGDLNLRFLETPGHTMESISIVVENTKKDNKQEAVLTGDALFINEVGRPDLAVKGEELTIRDLSDHLFDSLRKLTALDDSTIVFPAHGAGSPCGKNISSKTYSTIGEQKRDNYALQFECKDEFFNSIATGITEAPDFFKNNVYLNINNYTIPTVNEILSQSKRIFSQAQLEEVRKNKEIVILDTRETSAFSEGFIPGSINVPLQGQFALRAAAFINPKTHIVLVNDEETVDEAIVRLARTGLDGVDGYLANGFKGWKESGREIETVNSIEPEDLQSRLQTGKNTVLLDVRDKGELENGIVENSRMVNLNLLSNYSNLYLSKDEEIYVMCAGGVRSVMAYSVLKNQGYNVFNVKNGFKAVKNLGLKIIKPLIK